MRRGENFWLRVTTASAQCLRLSERFFSFTLEKRIPVTVVVVFFNKKTDKPLLNIRNKMSVSKLKQ